MRKGKEILRKIQKTGEVPETGEIIKDEQEPKGRGKNNNKQKTMNKREKREPGETGRINIRVEGSKKEPGRELSERELKKTISQIRDIEGYQRYIQERGGKDKLTDFEWNLLDKRYSILKKQEQPKETRTTAKKGVEIEKGKTSPESSEGEDEMAKTYREYIEEKEAETQEMVQTAEEKDLEKKKVEEETIKSYQEESERYRKQTEKSQAKRAREEAKIAKEQAEKTRKEKEKKEFETGYTDYYFKQEGEKLEKKKGGQETLDETSERIKKQEMEELAPEKLTTEKVNELMSEGKLEGENLSEISQLQDRVKDGEISKEDFAERIQEMIQANKENKEKLLAERELIRMIDESERRELRNKFNEETNDYIEKFVEKEREIKNYDKEIEDLEGKWFKGGKRKELEKSKDKAKKEKKEINENIEEKIDEYVTKYNFSASELRELIKKRKRQIKEWKGEKIEKGKEPTEEERKEIEKRAEKVEEVVKEVEEETEENIGKLTEEKKSIFEKLKSPKGRLLLIALMAGATVACPLTSGFGIYGLLHTGLSPMGANLIAGYIGGSEVVRNVRELIKARKQAKIEKE